jgi:hypothetical protein
MSRKMKSHSGKNLKILRYKFTVSQMLQDATGETEVSLLQSSVIGWCVEDIPHNADEVLCNYLENISFLI